MPSDARRRGTSRGQDELQIFVSFFISEYTLGDPKQCAKLDQGGNSLGNGRLKSLLADPAEAESAKSGFVGDTKQIITFRQGANSTSFAFRQTAFGTLHQAATPCIGRRITNRSEGC